MRHRAWLLLVPREKRRAGFWRMPLYMVPNRQFFWEA